MDFSGNEKIVAMLGRMLKCHAFAQAYLFSGPERVGKYCLANAFARSIVSKNDSLDFLPSEHGVLAMDCTVVEPEIEERKGMRKKKLISIEQVRKAVIDLNLYPYGGEYRTLVINDAHMLTIAAQNSLLKTLEEPNKTSVLILVTNDTGRILPTIKSRVQQLSFSLVGDSEMGAMVKDIADDASKEEYLLYAMGRPGLLQELLAQSDSVDRYRKYAQMFGKVRKGTINDRFKIAEELARDTVALMETLSLWLWICKKQCVGESFERSEEEYGMMDKIQRCIETMKTTNINARLVLENLFISL